jgi:hypothetical protein
MTGWQGDLIGHHPFPSTFITGGPGPLMFITEDSVMRMIITENSSRHEYHYADGEMKILGERFHPNQIQKGGDSTRCRMAGTDWSSQIASGNTTQYLRQCRHHW